MTYRRRAIDLMSSLASGNRKTLRKYVCRSFNLIGCLRRRIVILDFWLVLKS